MFFGVLQNFSNQFVCHQVKKVEKLLVQKIAFKAYVCGEEKKCFLEENEIWIQRVKCEKILYDCQ